MKLPAALPRSFDGWLYDPIARGFTGTQRRWLHKYGLIDDPIGVYHVTEAGRAWLDPQRERAQRLLQGGEPCAQAPPGARGRRAQTLRGAMDEGAERARPESVVLRPGDGRRRQGLAHQLRAPHRPRPEAAPRRPGRGVDEAGRGEVRLRLGPPAAAGRRGAPGVAHSGDVVRRAEVRGVARGREAHPRALPRPAWRPGARGKVVTVPGEPEGAVWYATGDDVQGVVAPLRDLEAPGALAKPGDTGGAER